MITSPVKVELGGVYVKCPVLGVGEADSAVSAGHDLGVRERVARFARDCPARLLAGSRIVRSMVDCPSTSLTATGLAATEERFSVTVSVADVSPSVSVAKY